MTKTAVKVVDHHEILQHVKIMRMLYGIELASEFYQKNFEELTGLNIKDLHMLMNKHKIGLPLVLTSDTLQAPRDAKK